MDFGCFCRLSDWRAFSERPSIPSALEFYAGHYRGAARAADIELQNTSGHLHIEGENERRALPDAADDINPGRRKLSFSGDIEEALARGG